VFGLALTASSQSNYATVTGTVRDAQSLSVAKATVQLKAVSTGAIRTVTTDERGLFSAAALLPDDYELTAQAAGFGTVTQSLRLEVGQKLAIDIVLKVGSVKEGVQVSAAADVLRTTDASVGEVVERKLVQDLPLNGRMLVEAPASTTRVGPLNLPIGGGGYFRILPYRWTQWGIERVNRLEGRPAIFYLHPWEIDPDQPRIAASALSRLRHYRHLDKTEGRLRRLLRDFTFSTVSQLLQTSYAADGAGLPMSADPRSAGAVTRRVTWV
jgi:hypothetical protein